MLEREVAGYRFIDNLICPIVNEIETDAIGKAIQATSGITGVHQHLQQALSLFADRESPDYTNSIKESFCAVEGMAQLILDESVATLGKALKKLKDVGCEIHPALEGAWTKLYGWSNDESGVRHAAVDDLPNPTFADAKYHLVSCSAFVNYLIQKASDGGIKLPDSV